jgi:Protein of unknown function (DUF4242)
MAAGTYLVERYLPGLSHAELLAAAARVSAAGAELTAEGLPVRYLGSLVVPGEEACFCEFEGPSVEAVELANHRAGVPFARVLPVRRISSGDVSEPQRRGR